ncbi:hypothetical protein CDV31_016415 [Fusarium ambrosium]|uniref:Uncharacterized protein n=1 Tax=Fusarium ambrosium TaxID=131363 RepID=A0A428S8Z3_9HYPO|nr:hypothetical protein CDV31_016415 [Fusarium ambrosium]
MPHPGSLLRRVLRRPVRRTVPQSPMHFNIAVMVSDERKWLADNCLFPEKLNTVSDGEGYEYSLHMNYEVHTEDTTGVLLPLLQAQQYNKDTSVWAVAPWPKKVVARIHGIIIVDGQEDDMLKLFLSLQIPVVPRPKSWQPWVLVRDIIQAQS